MTALPTLAAGVLDATNSSSVALNGSEPVLQEIASADDNTFVFDNNNATHVGSAVFALEDMPVNFGNMNTLAVRIRYHKNVHSGVNSWNTLTVQVYQSDLTTALTNERTIASNIATTTPTVTGPFAFTGVNTLANKAAWDGAVVVIRISITKSMGGDTDEERVTAIELTGDYTAAVPNLVIQNSVQAQTTNNVTLSLPVSLADLEFPAHNSHLPPILVGSTYYLCALKSSNLSQFAILATDTPNTPSSWEAVGGIGTGSAAIGSMAWRLNGTILHIAAHCADGVVNYWSFDTTTDTLSSSEEVTNAPTTNSVETVDIAFFNSEPHAGYSADNGGGSAMEWRHRATPSAGQWTGAEEFVSDISATAFAGRITVVGSVLYALYSDLAELSGLAFNSAGTDYAWGTPAALGSANAGTNLCELSNAITFDDGEGDIAAIAYVRSGGGLGFDGVGLTAETVTTSTPMINSETVSASLVVDSTGKVHAVVVLSDGSIIHVPRDTGSWAGSSEINPASSALIVHAGWVSDRIGYLYDEGAGLIYDEHIPSSAVNLVIQSSRQNQVTNSVVLVPDLIIQNSQQAQVTDNVVLALPAIDLVIQSSRQNQITNSVVLVPDLVIQSSRQNQVTDNVVLTLPATNLVIQSSQQAQTISPIVLTMPNAIVRVLGTSDKLEFATGGVAQLTHGTFIALIQVDILTGDRAIVFLYDSGGTFRHGFYLSNQVIVYHTGSGGAGRQTAANVITSTSAWYLVISRKGTGTVVPRTSVFNLSTRTWVHSSHTLTAANGLTPPGDTGKLQMFFGSFASPSLHFRGKIAALAIWENSLPWAADTTGDAAIEAADLENRLQSWFDANPDVLLAFNQSSVSEAIEDLTGSGADQANIVGTTVNTTDVPPGFDFTHFTLEIANSQQVQTTDNVVLSVGGVDLVIQSSQQAQETSSVTLEVPIDLVIQSSQQVQTADNIVLVPDLVIQSSKQQQTTDDVTLQLVGDLAIQSSEQQQVTSPVTLEVPIDLVIQSSQQSQTIDNIVLVPVYGLVIQSSLQAQTVENVTLTIGGFSLTIQDSVQIQVTESVTLVPDLIIQDSVQSQTVENVVLSPIYGLIIQDSVQAQTSESVTLTLGETPLLNIHYTALAPVMVAYTELGPVVDTGPSELPPLIVINASESRIVNNAGSPAMDKSASHNLPVMGDKKARESVFIGNTGSPKVSGGRPDGND
jgi:hypothetical protein